MLLHWLLAALCPEATRGLEPSHPQGSATNAALRSRTVNPVEGQSARQLGGCAFHPLRLPRPDGPDHPTDSFPALAAPKLGVMHPVIRKFVQYFPCGSSRWSDAERRVALTSSHAKGRNAQ
ncbi:hypothetical protein HRbin30_00855 [bacterium HR30]|nr:hypothetical protein HRbin30_00855 [bacterium HR30]